MKYKYGQIRIKEIEDKKNILTVKCVSIGIQGPANRAGFYLYNTDDTSLIRLGRSGIYELELLDNSAISFLAFDSNSTHLEDEEEIIIDYKYIEEGGANQ